MKIVVPVKRVVDHNVKIQLRADGSGVDASSAKMAVNPFDAIAVEEALRLREAGHCSEVVVVTVGPAKAEDILRTCLAMGADRGILVETGEAMEPLAVAKILRAVVEAEKPGLCILGKQSIDGDNSQTGQMLAALLDYGQALFASRIDMKGEAVEVTREVDGGLQILSLDLPAVITTDLRLNEPRFATLPNIMKAKSKPVEKRMAESLGLDIAPRQTIIATAAPPVRKAGIRVQSAAELVDKLRNDARIL